MLYIRISSCVGVNAVVEFIDSPDITLGWETDVKSSLCCILLMAYGNFLESRS